mmetsp:Transcript_14966/g.22703  ORF Transcript_14966/g.22703 Transcript_14966/m.22703 type:complete len:113 (+) Transcript_14966:228-566(+)
MGRNLPCAGGVATAATGATEGAPVGRNVVGTGVSVDSVGCIVGTSVGEGPRISGATAAGPTVGDRVCSLGVGPLIEVSVVLALLPVDAMEVSEVDGDVVAVLLDCDGGEVII